MCTDLVHSFFRVLRSKGAEFDPSPEHARGQVREDVHSGAPVGSMPEHKLVCGATCPICL